MRAAFMALLRQTITIEPFSTDNAHNDATYGTGVEYRARVENYVNVVRSFDGMERVSSTKIFIPGLVTLNARDRITLPSGFTPQQPPIIRIDHHPDETGAIHHTEIIC